jgi:prepilin-type processing-associated H-X9-DG protein
VLISSSLLSAQDQSLAQLGKSLAFHASFDREPDADMARGDRAIWTARSMGERASAVKGLPPGGEVTSENKGGRFGGALRFKKSAGPMVFFKAEGNFPGLAANRTGDAGTSGTVSFWLSTDPASDLPDGFCDPLQVTSKQWDDAAFFVEFEKRPAGIPFRLGVYADKSVWNPQGRKFEEIPFAEKPLCAVDKPPFASGKWTHVAFTFTRFNTGKSDGVAMLFLDGHAAGEISARTQTFSWDPQRAAVMLGLSYIGRMDDLAVFDRALSASEIAQLFALKNGVAELR